MILPVLIFMIPIIAPSFAQEQLEGLWKTDCTPLPKRHSLQTALAGAKGSIHVTAQLFSDRTCSLPSLTIFYSGEFELGETYGEGAIFDHRASKVDLVIQAAEVVSHYNKHEICGISDWKLREPRDVSGRNCVPYAMPAIGVTVADIYHIGTEGLQFGRFPRITTDGARPKTLSPDFLFRKMTH